VVKVEVDGDGVTFRRDNLDSGGIGGEGFCAEIEFEGSAGNGARATASTIVSRAAVKVEGSEELAAVINLNLEVSPEVTGAGHQRLRRAGEPVWRGRDEPAIRIRELDFNEDEHEFFLAAVIVQRLLRAVVADVPVGVLHKLDKGRQESDGRNIRTGLGRREILDVFAQYRRVSSVVALAEEIGFTNGLVGERSVKRGGGQRHTKNQKQAGDETSDVTHQGFPKKSIALIWGPVTAE